MTYLSPISTLAGIPQPINYEPLSSVENAKITVDDKEFTLWELLAIHIDKKIKLPSEIRNILLQVINPQISLSNRLELPFITQQNKVAIEIYWGHKRLLSFDDPKVNDLLRLVEIPYNSSDPEQFINSLQ
jgi:hypothetical protein